MVDLRIVEPDANEPGEGFAARLNGCLAEGGE